MSAIINPYEGGAGSKISIGVGFGIFSFKGFFNEYYGFSDGTHNTTIDDGFAVPPTLSGATIKELTTENSNNSVGGIVLALTGDQTALGLTSIALGGNSYSLGSPTYSWGTSQTVTIDIPTGIFTTPAAHGLSVDDPVMFTTTGALPTGISAGTIYYARDITSTTFTVAATKGGAAIGLSGSQSGTHTVSYQLIATAWAASATFGNLWGVQAPQTCTISTSTDTVTANGHTFGDGDRVMFKTTGSLPTGLSAGTIYYVVNSGTNTLQVALASGGAPIGLSGGQSGTHTIYGVADATIS